MVGTDRGRNEAFYKRITVFLVLVVIFAAVFPAMPAFKAYAEPKASAGSEIVIEAESGRVLGGYNIHARLPNASTTKVVTALITIERMDVNSVITMPPAAAGVEGSSIYLKAGEKWRIIDLLYGLMLRSGNDAATALAIACAGNVPAFADMMNAKAAELGLKNTHFTNPHGLHNVEHYTSAYDLAMLTREAYKHELFRTIAGTKVYRFTNADNTVQVFQNKNKLLYNYDGANGVKTGYTVNSGRCLVSAARRLGMQLIAVTLNCPDMWCESMRLLSGAFSSYKMYNLLEAGEDIGETGVTGAKRTRTMLSVKQGCSYPLTEAEFAAVSIKKSFNEVKAPVKPDTSAGKIGIYLENHLIFETDAYTIEYIDKKGAGDRFKDLWERWFRNEN